jgi:tetratricopeptide (TPR) repeat protein
MKSKRTLLAVIGATSGAAMLLLMAGCHHNSPEDLLAQGDAAMQATKLPDAEADYQQAEKMAPNDPRTHIALGNLYVFEHKEGEAQVEFMKVLEIDPKNAATHIALGDLYNNQGHHGLAENQYRAAAALEPDNSNYRLDLGGVLKQENKNGEAEAQIRTAVGLSPKDANAHLALADLLSLDPARAEEANAEFDEVRALDPKLLPAPASTVAAAAPAPVSGAVPPEAGAPKITAVNKLFLLTKNSAVYQNPDDTSATVGQVRRRKYVHVTGIAGNYLQIRLKNGTVGFIPDSAAE